MLTRARQVSALVACTVWTTVGLLLPWLVFAGGISLPSLHTALLMTGCVVLTSAFSLVRFGFAHGDRQLEVSPDTAFIVLAAVLLGPAQAALVALAGSYRAVRRRGRWNVVFSCANASLSAGVASAAVHTLVADQPAGRYVLPAAMVAAAVKDLLALVGHVLFEEARRPRSGVDLLRNTPVFAIAMLDVGLPVAAISMAGPFLGTPLAALVVVIAAEGFTWMVLRMLHDEYRQRRQNDYLRDTFSRYMPLPVADRLLEEGTEIEPGGEQREITVLFCDIREFTAWAEENQPDDVLVELNRMLADLSQAVINTDGTLDKFTGDGFMAFWGAPDDQPDHAARALRSVPQILMRVREFNMRREAEGKPALEVGVGINSGLAMVGNVGHAQRLDYTAVGDTVNLAARLEKATKEVGCPLLVSEATFLALPLGMQRQLARLESISVKGRRDRVRLYTMLTFARLRRKAG